MMYRIVHVLYGEEHGFVCKMAVHLEMMFENNLCDFLHTIMFPQVFK